MDVLVEMQLVACRTVQICFCVYTQYLSLLFFFVVFFLMIRRPPRSTLDRSSAASDVYKRQVETVAEVGADAHRPRGGGVAQAAPDGGIAVGVLPRLSLIHISEPTRPY